MYVTEVKKKKNIFAFLVTVQVRNWSNLLKNILLNLILFLEHVDNTPAKFDEKADKERCVTLQQVRVTTISSWPSVFSQQDNAGYNTTYVSACLWALVVF